MVARLVTIERDLRRGPFARPGVRSTVRGRRPEWPPVRRVSAYVEDAPWPPSEAMAGMSRGARPKVGGVRAPAAGRRYRVADSLRPARNRALIGGGPAA